MALIGGYVEFILLHFFATLLLHFATLHMDRIAFIFSLLNKLKKPFKVDSVNGGKRAIVSSPNFGPIFGSDGDWIMRDNFIASDSNEKRGVIVIWGMLPTP